MRTKAIGLTITAIFVSMANGQGQDKMLNLTNARTPQELQEAATLVRAIADTQQVSVDTAQKSVTVHGTPDQIALAQWLANELNQPVPPLAAHAFPLPVAGNDLVRMFYVFAPTPQELQETVTNIRS